MTATRTRMVRTRTSARPPAGPLPLLGRALAAIAAGGALWAAFPPLNIWPAMVVGVALLFVAVWRARLRTAAAAGALTGLVFWLSLLTWLRPVGVDAWLLLSVVMAAWFAAMATAQRLVMALPAWPLWGAALWVAQEAARDRWPFGGFSWGRLAFAQAGSPLGRIAAVGGAPLVTFAVALAGALLAAALLAGALLAARQRRPLPLLRLLAGTVAVVVAGLAVPLPTRGQAGGGPAYLRVAVVQGNVPRLGLEEFAQARAVLAYHVAETDRLAALVAAGKLPRPAVVIWPENASDLDPLTDPATRAEVAATVNRLGVPLLVGAVTDGPGPNHVQNAGIVWNPGTGPAQIYFKRHLVPFGEYIPFRAELSHLVGRFSLIPYDFVPGHRPGLLTLGPARIADVICYEVAYDGIVRQAVNAGGRLLVVQTNDATYEHPGQTDRGGESVQQLEITRLRAIESGRAAVVASTSGISAVVAPNGAVLARTPIFRPAILDRLVPLRDSRTLADRVGAWPEIVLSVAGIVALAVALVRRRRERVA